MQKFLVKFLFCTILSSCMSQDPAPIQHKYSESKFKYIEVNTHDKIAENNASNSIHIRNNEYHEKLDRSNLNNEFLRDSNQQNSQINQNYELKNENTKSIFYEVRSGDTLESIATKYQQPREVIINHNDLESPYIITPGQILEIKVSRQLLNYINREEENFNTQNNLYSGEFTKPVSGLIIKNYTEENKGITLKSSEGEPIISASDGLVEFAGVHKNFGNLVIIHFKKRNLKFAYAHMKDLILKKDEIIKKDQIIGHVGQSGNATQAQIYFAIQENGVAVDPRKFITF